MFELRTPLGDLSYESPQHGNPYFPYHLLENDKHFWQNPKTIARYQGMFCSSQRYDGMMK